MMNEHRFSQEELMQRRSEIDFSILDRFDMVLIATNGGQKYLFTVLYPANEEGKTNRAIGELRASESFMKLYGQPSFNGVVFVGSLNKGDKPDSMYKFNVGQMIKFALLNGDSLITSPVEYISVMNHG